MTSAKAARQPGSGGHHEGELDGHYGAIGISALAAALRYQSAAKNPAYARTDQGAQRQDLKTAG